MAGRRILTGVLLTMWVLAGASVLTAQVEEAWPPISKDDLALKDCPGSPGAPAMVLYRRVHTDDPKRFETHYSRIKIFTDEGKKYADIEIPYAEKLVKVEDIKARTVRPDGTAVDFQGEIFDRMVAKTRGLKVQAKTFTLPDVERGSIIEYSYAFSWREKVPDVYIHPSKYAFEGAHAIPAAHWTVQHELFTRRAQFSIRPVEGAQLIWTWTGLPVGKTPHKQPDGTVQLDGEDVPALQEEKYMPPADDLKGRVDFFYVLGLAGEPKRFWYGRAAERGEEVEKFIGNHQEIKDAVSDLIDLKDAPEDKLRKLYRRAQQIRNLSFENPKTEKEEKHEGLKENKSVADVLKHNYGSGTEINLLFVAMVRAAGFKAYEVRAASRRDHSFHQNLLDSAQLDSVVVEVEVDSKTARIEPPQSAAPPTLLSSPILNMQAIYLDPGTAHCPYGLLPWEESGVTGIRSDPRANAFVSTTSLGSGMARTERHADLKLGLEGTIEGQLRAVFFGQEALRRRLAALHEDSTGRRKMLEDEVKGWLPPTSKVDLTKVTGWESSDWTLEADFSLKIENLGTVTGRRLLLPLGVLQVNEKNPFQAEKRVHPIYFDYPFQENDEITIHLPKEYQVETLARSFQTAAGPLAYEIGNEVKSDGLHIRRHLTVNGYSFGVGAYPALREFFKEARAGDEEQLVLKRVETSQPK